MMVNSKVIEQIQQNLIAYYRLFIDLPGISFVENKQTTWIASHGMPGSTVLRTHVSSEMIPQHIDALLEEVGQICNHIDWWVFPECRPADLGQRLEDYGLAGGPDGVWELVGKIGGPGGTWMLADLDKVVKPAVSTKFRVSWVHDQEQLKTWQAINIAGFGASMDAYDVVYKAFARHGFGNTATARHCIGYLDDVPVTSATLFLAGGIASVYNVSTPSSLRRQGFGGAITHAVFMEAKKAGYQSGFIWSSSLGRGAYGSVGFIAVDIGMREYEWHKKPAT